MSTPVTITTQTVPSSFCFTTWQQSWTELVSLLSGTLAGNLSSFNFGSTVPTAGNTDKPWLRTDPTTGAPDRWYKYFNGVWASPHPISGAYKLYVRWLWVGIEDDVWSFDGGDGNNPGIVAPTDISGAMWEVDHEFDARMPIGPGTLPLSATVVNNTSTGGVDQVTLTGVQSGKLETTITMDDGDADTGAQKSILQIETNSVTLNAGNLTGDIYPKDQDPHENMPPYYGTFFIKRTTRLYYVAP